MSDSVQPHRRQPARLPRPWDSPRTLEWVAISLSNAWRVKSEREVAQSCPTLSDPMDCSLPGSSIHGIFQARVLERGAIAFSKVTNESLKKSRRKSKKYLEINENRNMMIQNMEHSKSSSKKKVNSYTSLRQETRKIWNYLTSHLKQLKKEQNKTQS